jgi:hypothetical protein
MTRRTRIQLGILLLALVAGIGAFLNQPIASGHNALHINCPPGSHGIPRSLGEGQRLEQARAKAKAARENNAAKP